MKYLFKPRLAQRILVLLIISVSLASSFCSVAAEVLAHRFKLDCNLEGAILELTIDTDLPDSAELIVSVYCVYFEVGSDEAYSESYFSEKGTVSNWRRTQAYIIDNQKWKSDLLTHQAKMARISSELAFEIDRIEDQLRVAVTVHANQSDPKFGGRGNPNLPGPAVTTDSDWNLVQTEVAIPMPLEEPFPEPEQKLVAFDGLEKGKSYELLSEVPLMAASPDDATSSASQDDKQILEQTKYLETGTVIKVVDVLDWSGFNWYEISVADEDKTGWINSVTLVKNGVILKN